MKAGVRALGLAESYRGERSTLAGAVVRANRTADGFGFRSCTVGGTDATDAVVALFRDLNREDVRYVLLSGVALAWYNVVDLRAVERVVERPVLSVTYEESSGLVEAMEREFSGDDLRERVETYRRQPGRERVRVNGETVYVRAVGVDPGEARDVVRAFTPEGGRPEPVRVARLAARAADGWRTG